MNDEHIEFPAPKTQPLSAEELAAAEKERREEKKREEQRQKRRQQQLRAVADTGTSPQGKRPKTKPTKSGDEEPASAPDDSGHSNVGSKVSQATRLLSLALELDVEFFHAPDGEPFVTVPVKTMDYDAHHETWALRSGPFRRWLSHLYYDLYTAAPSAQALQDALNVLEGTAQFHGAEHEVHLRLAEHEGAIYLDLGEELWQAVEITGAGWEVVADPPVRFRRPSGMQPLPLPQPCGEYELLRHFVNVTDDDWPLLSAFNVATLRPRGPYPPLVVNGEHGSAKSTTARVLRNLVDPNLAPLRSQPHNDRDLMIAARNGWILAFDNVSRLSPWLSDAFCRIATGGGYATRALYSNTDEVLIEVQRPIILNGIEEIATRADLLDRALILTAPRIELGTYRTEKQFWSVFERYRPGILGGLLDRVAAALANVGSVKLEHAPRMVDFARWAVAAEPKHDGQAGMFIAAYAGKRDEVHELALDASPLSGPLRTLAAANGGFKGTASELLQQLDGLVPEKPKSWPGSPSALAGSLRTLAPNLRAVGVEVEFDRDKKRRQITVKGGSSGD
jgi:hypothetical protein